MCLPGIRSPISRSELVKTKIEFFEIILSLVPRMDGNWVLIKEW